MLKEAKNYPMVEKNVEEIKGSIDQSRELKMLPAVSLKARRSESSICVSLSKVHWVVSRIIFI